MRITPIATIPMMKFQTRQVNPTFHSLLEDNGKKVIRKVG